MEEITLKLVNLCAVLASASWAIAALADAPRAIDLKVALPHLAEPVVVSVSSKGEGVVRDYPVQSAGVLRVDSVSGMFGSKVDESVCSTVAQRTRLYADRSIPPLMKEQIRTSIRESSSVLLHASALPFLSTNAFQRAILDAANSQGLGLNSVVLTNPLELRSYDVELALSPDALSVALGEQTELEEQVQGVFSAGTLLTGESAGEVHAMDLVCDLRSGAAKVSLKVRGNVRNSASTRALLPFDVAKALMNALVSRQGEFLDGNTPLEARRNAFLAGAALEVELRSAGTEGVSRNDQLLLFERLFDLDTGRPLLLKDASLKSALQVSDAQTKPFQGKVRLSFSEGEPSQ